MAQRMTLEAFAQLDVLDQHLRLSLMRQVEALRAEASLGLQIDRKVAFGQFFTPASVAIFLASMAVCDESEIHILDAGAGVGSLFAACVAQLIQRESPPKRLRVTAFEVDARLAGYSRRSLELCRSVCHESGIEFDGAVLESDFIESAIMMLRGGLFDAPLVDEHFTFVILNPPYRKIHSASRHRKLLRQVGIETSNLYTAFLALAMQLLEPGGQLVAITPRSFCNGPYFRSFREALLKTMSLRRFHIFESREDAFRDDDVLQENVILSAIKSPVPPKTVVVSSSAGPRDEALSLREVSYTDVVRHGDPQSFIHIVPDELGRHVSDRMALLLGSLEDLGLSVSTGRVVDFRAREFLRQTPEPDAAPLIYPTHFDRGYITWPNLVGRKPNALQICERTDSLLVPNENYVLVRRFSSKEEKRRIVAAVYDADRIQVNAVGFENHLNYFHRNGQGLELSLAKGLAAYLNSTLVDSYFRQFNGHTQVNATDLRTLRFPTLEQLERLGSQIADAFPDQHRLDMLIQEVLLESEEVQGVDPVVAKRRIDEALAILKELGFPKQQQNERSALALLALLDLKPETPWAASSSPLLGITPMMEFFAEHYGKTYAPNSRETVRRQTIHQFLDAGLIVINPDDPARPTNSGQTVYQIEASALDLMRTYGAPEWANNLRSYRSSVQTLKERYAQERKLARIPLEIAPGQVISLSPGGQNVLIKEIIEEFAPRFTPGGQCLYVGDASRKFGSSEEVGYFDEAGLAALGVVVEEHGKMPDVIIYYRERNWLVLIEAVTSANPINALRKGAFRQMFHGATAGLVFVTAFLTREAMKAYVSEIAWETEVWVADSPDHLIHFNGERFLGPRSDKSEE